jgi:hypothetical protein
MIRGLVAFAAAAMLTACSAPAAKTDNRTSAQSQSAAPTPPPAPAAPVPAAQPSAGTDTSSAAEPAAAAPTDTASATPADRAVDASTRPSAPEFREITIPAGTVLHVTLETPVGSDISRIDQPVRGSLRSAVTVHGTEALPAGTAVNGHVTAARRPGRVKGRGYVAMRFTEVDAPGEGSTRISSAAVGHLAPATKQKDALEVIAPAAGGALLGRVVGGKSGARKGAVVGGAAGTGYVLSTRGKEARLDRGASLTVKLTSPVTVRVRR